MLLTLLKAGPNRLLPRTDREFQLPRIIRVKVNIQADILPNSYLGAKVKWNSLSERERESETMKRENWKEKKSMLLYEFYDIFSTVCHFFRGHKYAFIIIYLYVVQYCQY